MPNRTATTQTEDQIAAKLQALAERAKQLSADTEELYAALALERNVRLARGTKRGMQPLDAAGAPVQPTPVDVASSPLYAQMREMLERRPMTLREVIEATKAEENKVKVVLMRMQRDAIGLENMGNRYRALWFIPGEAFRARMMADRAVTVKV